MRMLLRENSQFKPLVGSMGALAVSCDVVLRSCACSRGRVAEPLDRMPCQPCTGNLYRRRYGGAHRARDCAVVCRSDTDGFGISEGGAGGSALCQIDTPLDADSRSHSIHEPRKFSRPNFIEHIAAAGSFGVCRPASKQRRANFFVLADQTLSKRRRGV